MDFYKLCADSGVVPVVVLERTADAIPTAKALLAGNIHVMEITMRTGAAMDSIRLVHENCPEMVVGAGTVLTPDQAKSCVAAGAEFIVSPGYNEELVDWCLHEGVPILPGCVTPTELMRGILSGLTVFKFFPANIYGGRSAMKALSGPFGNIKFIPTGGVNAENLKEYLEAPYVLAAGGSWLCSSADISAGRFREIASLAAQASAIARNCKK